MIKIRNISQQVIQLPISGTLTAVINKVLAVMPFAGWISNLKGVCLNPVNGVTTSVLDINKNGTTIFSSTKMTIASTTGVVAFGALSTDPVQVAAGDIISVDVDDVGESPSGVCIMLTLSKDNPAKYTTLSDQNTVG